MFPLFAAAALGMLAAAPRPARATDARRLRLMTYNVNFGNRDVPATLDAIAEEDADIVLLQEITAEWQRALASRFAAQYPVQVFRIHTRAAGGLAVLSKLPIKAEEVLPCPERGWFPAERLVLETGFGALQILNIHLRPAIDGGSWFKGFLTTPPLRRREIEAYWKKLARDLPTIVAGDFNEDPTGSAIAFLSRQGLARVPTDGPTTWRYEHVANGKAHDVLRMDIDHVMVDRSLVGRNGRVLDAGTSDHRPVVVTIEPKR
ncbi:MAG TPA: endonuclease/exonuclease/phosphatase family protein [Kofleriaceae bacterium]|nr:endonuclease/exonuclease/phosphatase family protein [Kofleriaceae bacterium]